MAGDIRAGAAPEDETKLAGLGARLEPELRYADDGTDEPGYCS
jgi:hypothetical protein